MQQKENFILCDKCKAIGFTKPSACCPSQPKEATYTGQEILFYSPILSKEMMLKNWEGEPWIFFKHPDGQWVSYRQASERDISELCFNDLKKKGYLGSDGW